MTKDEALRLALEALYPISHNSTDDYRGQADKAITAIKAALETKDEPVADRRVKVKMGHWYGYDLEGHWFYLQPSDEYAEVALAKHTGSRRRTHD